MTSLLLLPPEVLLHVLAFVEPEDLASLPRTCRYLHDFVTGNNSLCRSIYLRYLVRSLPAIPCLGLA